MLLVIVAGLALLLWRSRKPEAEEASADLPNPLPESIVQPRPGGRLPGLRASFRKALRRLRRYGGGRSSIYKVPWFLLVGERTRRGLLPRTGLGMPFGPPSADERVQGQGLKWWFFDRGVVLDVKTAYDSRAWQTLLGLLQHHRPLRPIDSLVVSVDCQQLLLARRDSVSRQELQNRAERLYERVWQAQRRLGIRSPIYLLVTGCDAVPGFTGFCASLSEQRAAETMGWSSPYGVETAFRPEWVSEAFTTVGSRLREIQAELLATQPKEERSEEVFFFPSQLSTLEAPLRSFASRLFQQSVYHETLVVRGIYFTGFEAPVEPEQEGLYEAEPPRAFFLRDLFEQKIFPESSLAIPTEATFMARNRRVIATQGALVVTALILAVGMLWSSSNLRRANRVLVPFLEGVGTDLAQLAESRRRHEDPNPVLAQQRASRLFEGLSEVEIDRYRSLFFPASWIDDTDRQLRRVMRAAFEQIIFLSIRLDLEQRIQDLLAASTFAHGDGAHRQLQSLFDIGGSGKLARVQAVDQLAAFQEWKIFIEGLEDLEGKKNLYNGLSSKDGRTLDRLGTLVESLFKYRVADGFFDRSGLYAEALVQARREPLRPGDYREEADSRLKALSGGLDRSLYEETALREALTALEGELIQVRSGAWFSESGAAGVDQLIQLLKEVDEMLGREEILWAFRPSFDLGKEYGRLLTQAAQTEFLSPSLTGDLRRASEMGWIGLREDLAEFRSPMTGSLLALDDSGNARPELSGDVLVLKTALEGFRDERFMAAEVGQPIRTYVPAGSVMRWDVNLLQQAVGLYEPYARFKEGGLQFFPPEMRGPLEIVAKRRLELGLSDLIGRAQSTASAPVLRGSPALYEQELRGEVEILQQVAPIVHRLLSILDDLRLWDTRRKVAEVFASQGFRFLQEIDGLLNSRGLYEPLKRDFSWWDGRRAPAYQAFDAVDDAELASYLDRQRERVDHLARFLAQPLVASLGATTDAASDSLYGATYLRWQRILAEIDGYADKKPGNSLALLENFILQDLPKQSLGTCLEVGRSAPRTGAQSDYFLLRLQTLSASLRQRCSSLVAQEAVEGYGQLALFFNERLAGHAPFTADDATSTAAAAAGAGSVEPEVLRSFFALYDRYGPRVLQVDAADEAFAGKGDEVRAFIQALAAVRSFFAPYLDPPADGSPPPEVPTFDLRAEFRVNRERELGGQDIFGWRLEVGDKALSRRTAGERLRWEVGKPLRLVLQWAENGPREPLPRTDQSGLWVGGLRAVFEQQDPWALLSLLRRYRAERRDFESFADGQPHTLRLDLETVPQQASSSADEADDAKGSAPSRALAGAPTPVRVFVRIEVLPPDSEDALLLPSFPARAPEFASSPGEMRASRGSAVPGGRRGR